MAIYESLNQLTKDIEKLVAENAELKRRNELLGTVVIATTSITYDIPAGTEGVVVKIDKERWPRRGLSDKQALGVRFDTFTVALHWFDIDILSLEPSDKKGVPLIMKKDEYLSHKKKIEHILAQQDRAREKLQQWQGETE